MLETKNFQLEVARSRKEHMNIKYQPNRTETFHFPNLVMGNLNIEKVWKMVETKNFQLEVGSRPKEHMKIKY